MNETTSDPEAYTLCTDCMSSHEQGEAVTSDALTMIPDGTLARDWDEDYGVTEFSAKPCDGCGSTLAGNRFRYAFWRANPGRTLVLAGKVGPRFGGTEAIIYIKGHRIKVQGQRDALSLAMRSAAQHVTAVAS